jgi:hypothetical protein
MALSSRIPTYHSGKPGTTVYHCESLCWDGNNIEDRWYRVGTGGLLQCKTCRELEGQRVAAIARVYRLRRMSQPE